MKKLILLALTVLALPLAYADCPDIHAISHNCYGSNECSWQAPWYEGFVLGHIIPLHQETVTHFIKASWGRQSGQTSGDGTTFCYYATETGTIIKFVQNNWGGVAEPQDDNHWHWTTDEEGYKVKTCQTNCKFNYPN